MAGGFKYGTKKHESSSHHLWELLWEFALHSGGVHNACSTTMGLRLRYLPEASYAVLERKKSSRYRGTSRLWTNTW